MDNYFRTPQPIEFDITIERNAIVNTVVNTLNKTAEARFDGQNTQHVNNMQPEVDFEQDRNLVYGYYEEGVANIVRRIEPYVKNCETTTDNGAGQTDGNVFHLALPEKWKSSQQPVLETKIRNYLVHYIIAQWLEKVGSDKPRRRYQIVVSLADAGYTMEKAAQLLRDIKGVCELRKGKVHRIWNGTY